MGNIGLNMNLAVIKQHETGLCLHCGRLETLEHYLCHCPQYLIERAMLMGECGITQQDQILFILNSENKTHQRALIEYVIRTNRF